MRKLAFQQGIYKDIKTLPHNRWPWIFRKHPLP